MRLCMQSGSSGAAQPATHAQRATAVAARPPQEADGFGLPESAAILRYLCSTRVPQMAEHWYPPAPRARALVVAALSWHASTLRIGSMVVVWNRAISLSLGFQGNDRLVEDYGLPTLNTALQVCEGRAPRWPRLRPSCTLATRPPCAPPPVLQALDSYWLAGRPYVAGQEISVADLLVACEVEQLRLLDAAPQGPTFEALTASHPRVREWLERVRQRCAPHYDDVHATLRTVRGRLMRRGASKL
jgi:glutathione S-transferase